MTLSKQITSLIKDAKESLWYCTFSLNTLFIFCAASLLFYYPVIYGNAFHIDDLARVFTGEFGWSGLGRPFANATAYAYSGSFATIIDATPLSWILSIFTIAFTAKLLFLKLKTINAQFAMPLALIFIINPFFINNMMYRFDNLGMALAMLFVMIAFYIRPTLIGCVIKCLCLFVSLNFYQPFVNLFIGLVAIELLLCMYSNKHKLTEHLRLLLVSLVCFVVSMVLYQLEIKVLEFVISMFSDRETLLPESRSSLVALELDSILLIFGSIVDANGPFLEFWTHFIPYIIVVLPFAVFGLFKLMFTQGKAHFMTIFVVLLLVLASSIGAMALLKNLFIAPRGLPNFPIVMMLITCLLIMLKDNYKYLMLFPVFACLLFSYRVGNIHKIQSAFEKPIIAQLVTDIYGLKDVAEVYSVGKIPTSTFVNNITQHTPFGGYLGRDGISTTGLIREYDPHKIKVEWASAAKKSTQMFEDKKSSAKLLVDKRPYYEIYQYKNMAWVVWL